MELYKRRKSDIGMKKYVKEFIVGMLILVSLSSCKYRWKIPVDSAINLFSINRKMVEDYQFLKMEDSTCSGIPLEIIFYQNGFLVIDEITVIDGENGRTKYLWKESAENACVTNDGKLEIDDEKISNPERIFVELNDYQNEEFSLLNVYPTVLSILGVEYSRDDFEDAIFTEPAVHVVLFLLDGLGAIKLDSALDDKLISALEDNVFYEKALSAYPPKTSISTAVVFTGKPPIENGVYRSLIRKSDLQTICDVLSEVNLDAVIVEGDSLAVFPGRCEVILSGDRDLNGGTDDNVYQNVMAVLEKRTPDFLFIHFHGIDDIGHNYGQLTSETDEKLKEINRYIESIYSELGKDTVVITIADHGMHETGSGKGTHGNLIEEDMVVFIHINKK